MQHLSFSPSEGGQGGFVQSGLCRHVYFGCGKLLCYTLPELLQDHARQLAYQALMLVCEEIDAGFLSVLSICVSTQIVQSTM